MRIGIMGAGNMGAAFARRLATADHEVSIAAQQLDEARNDDAGAKDTVRRLAESIGFEPVDSGPLTNARYLAPLGMLNIWLGYVGGRGTNIAPRWDTATSGVPVAV